jgi:hypothetical protein
MPLLARERRVAAALAVRGQPSYWFEIMAVN